MIAESEILCTVKNLEHSRGRIAVVILRELVDLVEKEYGIDCSGLLHRVDYPAGHRTDICAPVAADLRFVTDTAEAHSHEFPSECPCDRCRNGSFADARRADETDYLAVDLSGQFTDCEILNNALLDLFEPVMVFVEDLPCVVDIKVVFAHLVIRKLEHRFNIGAHRRALM